MYSFRMPAIPLALMLAFPSVSIAAEQSAKTETDTLPEVSVSAKKNSKKDKFITQDRATSVGKSPVSVQDMPQSVTVVDVDQAREMGALNIQDALTYSAGVYAGNFGFDTRITDRDYWASSGGFPGNGYLVLGAPRTVTVSAQLDF